MSEPLSAEAVSAMTGVIYDCAVDPSRWPGTLRALRRELKFQSAALNLMDAASGRLLLNVASGIEQVWLDRMPAYASDVMAQWGGPEKAQSYSLGEPQVLSMVNPRAVTEANRYYVEWAEPQGIIDMMAIVLSRDAASMGTIGLGRHRDAGPIGSRDVAGVRLLVPHLQRALAISRLLEIKAIAATTYESVLDALTAAVVLVDADRRPIFVNVAADRMLAAGDPLRIRSGRITALSKGAASALEIALARASRDEAAIGGMGMSVPAWSAHGAAYVLHVLPLRSGERRPELRPGAVAMIFVAAWIAPGPAPLDALATLFQLTPAEARVLEQVAQGRSNAETAATLGIATNTVKSHLQQVFAKTGTCRRADLVGLLASLSPPLDR